MNTRVITILVTALGAGVLAAAAGSPVAHAQGEIDVEPLGVKAGQSVTITLTCASTTGKGIIDGPTSFGGGEVALTNGAATVTRTVPATTPKGDHLVMGYCEDDPDTAGYTATDGMTITVT
ncbi:hypothetical protein [Nonomuraea rubra]|uniref:Ig-like domain repeat protein n=1 Tax=Nonomuraea rubra TaxID=46180 RepID=A0A7X0NYE1_9ACTN|nr:hypothetical protein [Nonomuraea rubra]MBB6551860.1 hypothetical protein [Nonomuraea rubra]